jgi:hypothetical protein
MDLVLRILAFLIGGSILAYLTILYLGAVVSALFPPRDAKQIAPIQMITDGKPSTELGEPLAQMLLVRLGDIRHKLDIAARALRPSAPPTLPPSSTGVSGPVEQLAEPITPLRDELPNRLQQSFNVQLAVGGVELSGLTNWLFRQIHSEPSMRIVIETVGTQKYVYGNFDPDGMETFAFWLPRDISIDKNLPSNDKVLTEIAYRIAQRSISRSIPELGAFAPDDFAKLLEGLSALADLNRRIQQGWQPAKEFDEVLRTLDPLVRQVPGWIGLTRITGEVAERANNPMRAKELYASAKALAPPAQSNDWQARIDRVEKAIAALGTQSAPVVASAPARTTALSQISQNLLERLRKQISLDALDMAAPVKVAIVGSSPISELATSYHVSYVGPTDGSRKIGRSDTEAYFTGIMSTVALIAPKAEFVFSNRDVMLPSDAVASVTELLAEKPQVLLLPLKGVFSPPMDQLLAKAAEQNTVVILSAGNDGPNNPVPFAGSPLLDRLMLISAVDETGAPAPFSQRDPKSFWTIGRGVPTAFAEGWRTLDGTGPAAAVAAGIVAHVISIQPGASAARVIQALRDGSTRTSPNPDAPAVLNALKAIEKLTTIVRAPSAPGAKPHHRRPGQPAPSHHPARRSRCACHPSGE